MRKNLLLIALTVFSLTAFGQTIWNVGNDPTNFPVSGGIGAGPDKSFYVNGLGIHTGTVENANMGQIEANAKTFTSPTTSTEYTFVNRFKFNGGGYSGSAAGDVTPSTMMPTQRYLTVNVSGNSTLYFIGTSGSSSSARKMFVTNGTNLIGTLNYPDGTLQEGSVEYTGSATTLYIYCNLAINLYYISATNAVTSSVNTIDTNKTIVSEKLYNILGHEIPATSKGLVLRKVSYSDGTASTVKNFIRWEN